MSCGAPYRANTECREEEARMATTAMEITRLGRAGMQVSRVCLGTMTFGNQASEETAFAIMDAADAAGMTFFYTADAYPLGGDPEMRGRTEEIVGKWLRERGEPAPSGNRLPRSLSTALARS